MDQPITPPQLQATWGATHEMADPADYGIGEDTPTPFEAEGFTRREIGDVGRWSVCRFDSAAARGFSTAVGFSRTLQEQEQEQKPA